MGSETRAREMGAGPICDRCETPLGWHGDTFAGVGCDLALAMDEVGRALGEAIFGPRRWARWWRMSQIASAKERARMEARL